MNTVSYAKLLSSTRHWLKGLALSDNRYYDVLRALEFFSKLHGKEIRKDGVTLGFYHQLSILAFARTQHRNLSDPASVYIAILGHDAIEDYPDQFHSISATVSIPDLQNMMILDKNRSVSYDEYFDKIANSEVCSFVKGVDRIHNFSTMAGVFSIEKQEAYAQEGREYFIPMLKTARRGFPNQEPVYELLKSVMMMQIHATDTLVDAIKTNTKGKEPTYDL